MFVLQQALQLNQLLHKEQKVQVSDTTIAHRSAKSL